MIAISLPIEDRWERMRVRLEELARAFRMRSPAARSQVGRWLPTEATPFSAYAAFGRTAAGPDEELVFSLRCRRTGDVVVATSDWARGDGQIVREGPGATVAVRGEILPDREMLEWLAAVEGFLEKTRDVLSEGVATD